MKKQKDGGFGIEKMEVKGKGKKKKKDRRRIKEANPEREKEKPTSSITGFCLAKYFFALPQFSSCVLPKEPEWHIQE